MPHGRGENPAQELLAASGLAETGATFHALRHTYCTRLVEKGADLPIVQALAGHSAITTTMRYVDPSEERGRAFVRKLGHGMGTGKKRRPKVKADKQRKSK